MGPLQISNKTPACVCRTAETKCRIPVICIHTHVHIHTLTQPREKQKAPNGGNPIDPWEASDVLVTPGCKKQQLSQVSSCNTVRTLVEIRHRETLATDPWRNQTPEPCGKSRTLQESKAGQALELEGHWKSKAAWESRPSRRPASSRHSEAHSSALPLVIDLPSHSASSHPSLFSSPLPSVWLILPHFPVH